MAGLAEAPAPEAKPAIPPTGSRVGRISQCESHRAEIEAALERGLSAQRIDQDLRESAGFVGGYDAVKRFVRALGHSPHHPDRKRRHSRRRANAIRGSLRRERAPGSHGLQ